MTPEENANHHNCLLLNKELVSVSQYARIRNVTVQAVRKAIKEGRLTAGKIGNQWVLVRPTSAEIKTSFKV